MTADQINAIITGSSVGTTSSLGSSASWTNFVATNATPGTAITATIATSFSATASAFFSFRNGAATTGGNQKVSCLDYIKLLNVVAPASATSAQFAIVIDGETSNRYTSGGTAIVPVNPNATDSTASSVTQLYAGALTTAAASSQARLVSRGTLRGVIPTANDEYLIQFGAPTVGGSYASAAASGRFVVNAPVILFGPQQFCLVHLWFPANSVTAATYEFEIGYREFPLS